MNRADEKHLARWLLKKNRKPLIIRGARQVGKSTLVGDFCKKERLNLFVINLERHLYLLPLFKAFKLKEILLEIEMICEKQGVLDENSVVFFDEIQAVPDAIAALRYFYEDYPNLKVLAAGSLLEFVLSEHSFSMPVGRVDYLFMGPMTFEEFLLAKKEDMLLGYLREFNIGDEFSITAHENLIALQRDYFLVGGMPEAVQVYIDSLDLREVSIVHASILETYIDDFAKYASGQGLQALQKVFNYVGVNPSHKIKYTNIDSGASAREVKKAILLLEKAKIILPVCHSAANGIPLSAEKNERIYKLFFLDIGLMNRLSKISGLSVSDLQNIDFVNKGVMAEQFISQQLLDALPKNETPSLFYWLREGKSSNAEIDFVVQEGGSVVPVEVKAGAKGMLKSLHRFAFEKKVNIAVRFDMNVPSLQKVETRIVNRDDNAEISYKLISLPLYMAGQMRRIVLSAMAD